MGIDMTGKFCFSFGIVLMLIGAWHGYQGYLQAYAAVDSVTGGVDNSIKAHNQTTGTFTIEKTTVEFMGSVVPNDITVMTTLCTSESCPIVEVLDATMQAFPCEANLACKCMENETQVPEQTICILKQPPIGTYSFSSNALITILSKSRALEAGAGALGSAVGGLAAFSMCVCLLCTGSCVLCITFVLYECGGQCSEKKEPDSDSESEEGARLRS